MVKAPRDVDKEQRIRYEACSTSIADLLFPPFIYYSYISYSEGERIHLEFQETKVFTGKYQSAALGAARGTGNSGCSDGDDVRRER